MPVDLIAQMLWAHPFQAAVLVVLVLLLALQSFGLFTARHRRHRRYQEQAARALQRLPQLRDDAARIVWLRKMNPYVFEEMLLSALSAQGHRIKRNASYSGDGGVDGQVWIDGQRWLIQAKRYAATISAAHVSDFGLLVRREGCRGLFIHTGRTGAVCREAFSHYPAITLISGQNLLMLLSGDDRWQHSRKQPAPRRTTPR